MRRFLVNGKEVELVKEIDNGFLVQDVYYQGEDEEESLDDTIYFVEKVFEYTPTEKYDGKIKALLAEIDKLENEKRNLANQIKEIQEQEKNRFLKYKQYAQLKRLDDFLDGKLTHYVILDWTPKIVAKDDAKCSYDKSELKLLSLFGESRCNLEWRLNEYKDGSGYWQTVIPCCSYEEALEYLTKEVIEKFKSSPSKALLKVAKEYNIQLDAELVRKFEEKMTEQRNKEIEQHKKEIERLTLGG